MSQGLLLLPGQNLSALKVSHIPTIRRKGAVGARGQPEAGEICDSRHKYVQNGVILSAPGMLLGGFTKPSNSL